MDAVDLFLKQADLLSGGALLQAVSRPGGRDAGDGLGSVDIEILSVEGAQDLNGPVAIIAQGFAPPLGHPAGALDLPAVAVLGEERLAHIGPGEIGGKEFVYDDGDGVVDVPLRDPFVVKGGGGSDGEIIAHVPVPFGVHSV